MRISLLATMMFLAYQYAIGQGFLEGQKSYPRVSMALRTKEDSLKKRCKEIGVRWPPKQLYFRSFKYDSQLEAWARNNNKEPYRLIKVFPVCALSGRLGPKREQGDYQVPEGFYYINEFKPASNYHLALGLNYPNLSDLHYSDSMRPGGDIDIHGSCITVGCIPVKNTPMEEVYVLAALAKNEGADYIPVHIFPIRYNVPSSVDYFLKMTATDPGYQKFAINLKSVFDYFETNKKLPVIGVSKKGEYIIF